MNLVQLLNEYGVQPHQAGSSPHVTEGWVGYECPFCGKGTSKYGLGINLNSGGVSCWKCGVHSWSETLAALTNLTLPQAIERLKGVSRSPTSRRSDSRGILRLPDAGEIQPAHERYLQSRGFNVHQVCKLWKLKGIGISPVYGWSLLIPIIFGGEVVSWTTRKIGGRPSIRYQMARFPEESILPRSSLLYGYDYVRNSVVVVEGPADVWAVGPGAVATLGTGHSRRQVALLSRIPTRVVMFDSDPQAQRRARRLASELFAFPGTTHVVELQSGPDPAAASPREIARVRSHFLD